MNAQTILVTGASSGFGRLTAEGLAGRGHRVFAGMRHLADRNLQAATMLRDLATSLPGTIEPLNMDVTDDASVRAAVDTVFAEADRLDAVVNNAGVFTGGPLEAYPVRQIHDIFDVNVYGALRVNRAVLPHLRARRSGLLVHVSSVAARTPFPFSVPYAATKSALETLAEGYRYELAPLGVDSVIVEPSAFPTPIFQKQIRPGDENRLADYDVLAALEAQVLGGLKAFVTSGDAPDPREVADAIVGLIETPAGRRPLRTVVGTMGDGIREINETATRVQEDALKGAGLERLLGLPPT
jgi:NAD(P)-dependent dehydrogenase (short-subunit alcohol dehydrogenase family)